MPEQELSVQNESHNNDSTIPTENEIRFGNPKDLRVKINNMIQNAQTSIATHPKCVAMLHKLYEQAEVSVFLNEFKQLLQAVLVCDYKVHNDYTEKLIELISSFCTSTKFAKSVEDAFENPFLKNILLYLFETSCVESHIVRYRSCQILNSLFDKLTGVDISEELFDELQSKMLGRLQDKKVDVVLQAITALKRLQNPYDPDDAVINSYISLMVHSSYKVRQSVTKHIAITKQVIPHIITRTTDTNLLVALAAYKKLSKLVKALRILERQKIIINGFIDKRIKTYAGSKLVQCWFDTYNGNYVDFIKALRLDATEEDINRTTKAVEFALSALFRSQTLQTILESFPILSNQEISFSDLNWDTAIFWRVLVQYLRQSDHFEDVLDKILPNLVPFCQYVERYCKWKSQPEVTTDDLEQQYILEQLLIIIKGYDFGDAAGRQYLIKFIQQLLQKEQLNCKLIELCMIILQEVIPNINALSTFVCETISEIIFPNETSEAEKDKQFELAQLQVQIQETNQLKSKALQEENFVEAENCKLKTQELEALIISVSEEVKHLKETTSKRDDVPTILKYLDIAYGLLHLPKIKQMTPTLITLKEDVIQGLLIHNNKHVRSKALKCYTLFCIIDEGCAKVGIHLCSGPILQYGAEKSVDEDLLIAAIPGIVDILLIYDTHMLTVPEEITPSESFSERHRSIFAGGTGLTELIQGLLDLADSDTREIELLAVKGLCKLVFHNRIQSPSLLSRLILKWASPSTDDNQYPEIRRYIGCMLQAVAYKSETASDLEKAILPTVRALVRAPKNSPLAEVYSDVMRFLVALCSTSSLSNSLQESLCQNICETICNNPNSPFNKAYSELLLLLEVPKKLELINYLLEQCDAMRDDEHDKKTTKNVVKYIKKLKAVYEEINLKTDPEPGNNSKEGENKKLSNSVESTKIDEAVHSKNRTTQENLTANSTSIEDTSDNNDRHNTVEDQQINGAENKDSHPNTEHLNGFIHSNLVLKSDSMSEDSEGGGSSDSSSDDD